MEKLGRHFRQNDIKFFRDEDQIKAGQEISEECKKAMDNSKVFLPIISKTYSDGVSNMEFYYNKKQARKPLVVVVMPGTTESNIPYNYEVQNVKQVRLKEEDMKEESLRKRLDEIVVGVMDKLKGMSIISCKLC